MSTTLQIIGEAMRAEVDALRVVSQNVANAQTTAYRRQVSVVHGGFDNMLDAAAAAQQAQTSTQSQTRIDQTPGTLKHTGEPLNVALDGPGFFVAQGPEGPLLTRRGDLHVGTDGTLQTFAGQPVLGDRGVIQLGDGKVDIDPMGVIRVNGTEVDRLRIVTLADTSSLQAAGDGNYRADVRQFVEGDSRPAVRQGFLEASNVAPINELVNLMETVRRFETEQKFATAYSGMMDRAISELGKVQ